MNLDLEGKCEEALIARLSQHPDLSSCDFKHNVSDTKKFDGSIVVRAQRGEENPAESGVFNISIEIELNVRMQTRKNTLPDFNKKTLALERVLCLPWRQFVEELNAGQPDFHCYFFAVIDKDPSPVEDNHACIWSCNMIAMNVSFSTALINTNH